MIITNLLTKYILTPIWTRFLIFLFVYFAILQIHFFDQTIHCMNLSSTGNIKDSNIINLVKTLKWEQAEAQRFLAEPIRQQNIKSLESGIGYVESVSRIQIESAQKMLQLTQSVLENIEQQKLEHELIMRERLNFHEAEKKGLYRIINSMNEKNHLKIQQIIAEFVGTPEIKENASVPVNLQVSSESKILDQPVLFHFEKGSNPVINIINNTPQEAQQAEQKNTSWFSWCNIS